MSDEKRNISDINDQKTAEQQAFSEEIRRRLAEPGSGKPTLDEFKVMVYKDREKRRKKRNALVACIVAAFIVGYLTYDDLVPEVGADKNPKEEIVTEERIVIEDKGWGSGVEADNVWLTEDWEQVNDAKELYAELVIPQYVPNEYMFQKLTIETVVDNDIVCKYLFVAKTKEKIEIEVFITTGGNITTGIEGAHKIIRTKKGDVYWWKEKNNAIILIDDGIIVSIWCSLSESEISRIVNGLVR